LILTPLGRSLCWWTVIQLSILVVKCPKEKDKRTNNTMTKRKRTKGQITQWPKEKGKRTNNTMAKGKEQKDK
jgi:hypothetical protein